MKTLLYSLHREIGEKHWWCRARRDIVLSMIRPFVAGNGLKILEIGCGVGNNLEYFKRFGDVTGADSSPIAIEYAREKTGLEIVKCVLPFDVPFGDQSFDLVIMLDVLEHIDEDIKALKCVYRLLRHGGILVCTVPAYPFLWSVHDELFHHKRRYTLTGLKDNLSSSNYLVKRITYYNFLLFPLGSLIRVFSKLLKVNKATDFRLPPTIINEALFNIFRWESSILSFLNFPVGMSVIAISEKGYSDTSP